MSTSINANIPAATKAAAFAVFDDADNSSASFAARLLKIGIGDRATAKPLVMEWASIKYKAAIVDGQRGPMLPRNSAAEKAMARALAACFPSVDLPKSQAKAKRNNDDAVGKLLAATVKGYAKLTAGEKRSFKAKLSAAL
jgi:hypothetical protein